MKKLLFPILFILISTFLNSQSIDKNILGNEIAYYVLSGGWSYQNPKTELFQEYNYEYDWGFGIATDGGIRISLSVEDPYIASVNPFKIISIEMISISKFSLIVYYELTDWTHQLFINLNKDGSIWFDNSGGIARNGNESPYWKISGPKIPLENTSKLMTPIVNRLRIRAESNLDSSIIDHLNIGDIVSTLKTGQEDTISGYTGNWYEIITTEGTTGWCFGGLLQEIPYNIATIESFN